MIKRSTAAPAITMLLKSPSNAVTVSVSVSVVRNPNPARIKVAVKRTKDKIQQKVAMYNAARALPDTTRIRFAKKDYQIERYVNHTRSCKSTLFLT